MAARGGGGGGDMATGDGSGGGNSGAGAGGGDSGAGAGGGDSGAGAEGGNPAAGAGDDNPAAGTGSASSNPAAGAGDDNPAAVAGSGGGAPVTGAGGRSDGLTADVGVRGGKPAAGDGLGEGDVTAGVGRQVRWLVLVPLVACLAIAVPDLLFDRVPPLIVLLLVGPLLACVRLGVRHTVLACCWSAVLGLAMGIGDRTVQTFAFAVHWSALLLGCTLTVYAARQRARLIATLDRAREAARITQEAILRPISRTLGGTQVCTRYHSAARESAVGGDLYDVAVTPYGLRVLVGDVRGHGLDALRLTAETITGFRDLAYMAPDLATLIRNLDARLAPEMGPEDFVTAVLAEFAPGEVRLVNCGHPAPLRAGHRIELLEPLVPAPPLGLHPDPRQYRVRLQPGDRLLLYTDGLTEARDPEGAPFPLLGEAALALREPLPDEALHTLYARLIAHTGSALADDLALVLCQPVEATVPARVAQ
ncbi:hypothetical protein GCM10011579_089960 [Streptomyces albiflavescens]|uniref:PPM-type phosphatase domain-containing protein n=1 Tax=Streptomyces albiflavescens TaxID=1623582 RepID=A0A918D9Z6_9ACTN|nr:PP2C family protein-serine/threonine phosphatase [Streptomyces albiflavescens]GGN92278.1 hypothetical protein GCM10011579_089960 [Streptomyces albiflavescens]